jgi:hypothetical protein
MRAQKWESNSYKYRYRVFISAIMTLLDQFTLLIFTLLQVME